MLNKIMLIGNLGRDPEMSYTPTGTAVTKFSLAVSRRWNDKASGQRKEETTWLSCVAWNQLAETCNTYLHKGSKVYVEGRMTSRKYTDRDNVERTAWDVQVGEMEMLDGKPSQEAGSSRETATQPAYGQVADDGIPF